MMCEPCMQARAHADRLLAQLAYLLRATRHGGQASELHLNALLEDLIGLLVELGGFDDLIHQHGGNASAGQP